MRKDAYPAILYGSFSPCGPQVDREDADITEWDSGCPDMSEHNSRDCAALISISAKVRSMCGSYFISISKELAARYRDLPCMQPVEEIQVQLLLEQSHDFNVVRGS